MWSVNGKWIINILGNLFKAVGKAEGYIKHEILLHTNGYRKMS